MSARAVALALVAFIGSPASALAWCRTTTCAAAKDAPAECYPGEVIQGCQKAGTPLFWPNPCVSFSVQRDGSASSEISADQLQEVVRTSFDNWQNVTCEDGRGPNITVKTYAQVECAESRYNQSAPNQNVWMFRDDAWPHAGDGDRTIALTLVSFNPKTGEIYDVDVELNSFQRHFSLQEVSDVTQGDDLYSVVQHESGHFLGLAHSADGESTMWSNYNGSVDMRSLESDDAAGICAAYPPSDTQDTSCNADPRHGFSTKCLDTEKACAFAPASDARARQRGLALLAAAMLGLVFRRRIRWGGSRPVSLVARRRI